jgi:flagella basal body P-ring formation protein FlgA
MQGQLVSVSTAKNGIKLFAEAVARNDGMQGQLVTVSTAKNG